jgi:hypothetical protein
MDDIRDMRCFWDFEDELLQKTIEQSKQRRFELLANPPTTPKSLMRSSSVRRDQNGYTDSRIPLFAHAVQFRDDEPLKSGD